MSDALGALCIVLHGHLPYVLHHGQWPHGEEWLYEAAVETYLPLLDLLDDCAARGARPGLTVGLTPILLEQLASDHFKRGFAAYLAERAEHARRDRIGFDKAGQAPLAAAAERWSAWHARAAERFERIARDIPGQFARHWADNRIQIITSAATHGYLPLMLRDESIRAQLACGAATTERHLGRRARGMWLPECAYRPTWDHWIPSVLYDDARVRPGLERFIAEAGVDHFVVPTHLVTEGQPMGVTERGQFRAVVDAQVYWDVRRGWRDPLQPVGVVSAPEPPRCFAFARHPRVSEQVWSGVVGYPASGEYLEFHRKHGDRGLRYHRITGLDVPIADKQPYDPAAVPAKLYEQSQHFCQLVRDLLREFKDQTGLPGVCVAPFDAELFGHWWFEGPQFLRDVVLNFADDPSVRLMTTEQALASYPPDKVVRMPEGSWGEGGNHGVWINDRNRWMWEMEYRAENRMAGLLHDLPWRRDAAVRAMVERAGRELLLLQASDWPFVVHGRAAADYGVQRFAGHYTGFDRLARIAGAVARGETLGDVERVEVDDADLHDGVFSSIDLNWWA